MLLPTPATAPGVAARQTAVVLADLVGAKLAGHAESPEPVAHGEQRGGRGSEPRQFS